jgi:hypothetical protein
MIEKDPSKYPARMGEPWGDEEVLQLLTLVQKKKTVDEISNLHERTVGSINSKLKSLAMEYYFNDNRPIEEIQKFTGLTKEVIEYAVNIRKERKTKVASQRIVKNENTEMSEIITILKDIQNKLTLFLEKTT